MHFKQVSCVLAIEQWVVPLFNTVTWKYKMFGLIKFIIAVSKAFIALLDPNKNALKFAPPQIKYGASILLSCLWCLAFGVWAGELWVIGYNMLGHIFIVSMVFVTYATFRTVQSRYPDRNDYELLRDPARTPKCYEMTDEERQQALQRTNV